MGIKTDPHPPYNPDVAPCDFWLFPNLKEKRRGCRYETIKEMEEAVTKVIDTLTQEEFHSALQKFHVCTINKSGHPKKSLETYWRHLVWRWRL